MHGKLLAERWLTDRSSCDRNCKFVHHKSHMKCGGTEPGALPRGKITACNRSGCGIHRLSLLDMLMRVVNVARLGAAKRWQRESNLNIITNHLNWHRAQCRWGKQEAALSPLQTPSLYTSSPRRIWGTEDCLHEGEWKVISSAYRKYIVVPSLLTSPGWGPMSYTRLLYCADHNTLQVGPVLGRYIAIQILKLF